MALPAAWWVAAACSWCTRVRAASVVLLRLNSDRGSCNRRRWWSSAAWPGPCRGGGGSVGFFGSVALPAAWWVAAACSRSTRVQSVSAALLGSGSVRGSCNRRRWWSSAAWPGPCRGGGGSAGFSVPWHFRQSGGPQRPALGPLECGQSRQYYWDWIATVGAAIGAIGGHLRRDLGRAVVVVAVLDFSVPWHFRQSGGPQRPALGPLEYEQHRWYC